MMKKSGYFQKTGCIALDSRGISHEAIVLNIEGVRYAIRRADLTRAVAGRVCVQIEALVRNWQYYLGHVAGLAQISASGRALNIDIFSIGEYTVSLRTLRAVLYGKERFAVIVKIPEQKEYPPIRKVPYDQQRLEAAV
ncbi:MAG: hypothetical protein A4E35_00495 [Methanoregula sp. PtaU1.Bin051]|nr:MAG: hypothetical protein A4E35_00495 [Methanoregula sp. PtaU1.Bin051]